MVIIQPGCQAGCILTSVLMISDLAYWRVGNLETEGLLRWRASRGPGLGLEAVRLQTDLLRQARSRGEIPAGKRVEFALAGLFHAIQKLRNTKEQLHRRGLTRSCPPGSRRDALPALRPGPGRSALPERNGPLSLIIMN